MATLTALQKQQLVKKCNSININTLMKYVQAGEITLEELTDISPERRQFIENSMSKMPNPLEQQEWEEIQHSIDSGVFTPALLTQISNYINKWDASKPTDNHLNEARIQLDFVNQQILKIAQEQEEEDWKKIDSLSIRSMVDYLSMYPNSVHKDEIDDSVWGLIAKDDMQDLSTYLQYFPAGKHQSEARALRDAFAEWANARNSGDIFEVNRYVRDNPGSPFYKDAETTLLSLKQQEMRDMKENPNQYEPERLKNLLDRGVFTDRELIFSKVMTQNVLDTLKDPNSLSGLPDVKDAIAHSTAECKEGYTDVFFFGVPSTGKTCVLMGMSRSQSLNINLASGGGDYAAALQQYTDVGITVPRTPGSFVTTLEATISSQANNGAKHSVNLVEMSGEEFAFGIAGNPDHEFTFEEMGTGATELLKNDNDKVFFLVIDPTASVVRINREIRDGFDEETGKPITHLEYCRVNQRTLIQKMVNLFQNPDNADIMRKVNSIHIIMTKSDTLGNQVERDEKALEIFNSKFKGDILEPLKDVCLEYNINVASNYKPKLYTFSLGKFYVGGLYEYEPEDSDKLVRAIMNSTHAVKTKSFWEKFKDKFNN